MAWDTPKMDVPEIHYARSGGAAIAYQVVGEGPRTLVYAPPVTNLYSLWELPRAATFLRRLSEGARVVVFNPRGTGLSDRPPNLTLEARTEDVNAVLDAIRCARATIFGADVSANVCALFAATYPERCDRLALFLPHARGVRSDSYPHGPTREQALEWIREWRNSWGDRDHLDSFARALFDPALTEEEGFLDWFVRERRLAVSPQLPPSSRAWRWTRTSLTYSALYVSRLS